MICYVNVVVSPTTVSDMLCKCCCITLRLDIDFSYIYIYIHIGHPENSGIKNKTKKYVTVGSRDDEISIFIANFCPRTKNRFCPCRILK